MANRAKTELDTEAKRADLKARVTPYFFSLPGDGRMLGYIRQAGKVAGTWVLRLTEKGERTQRAFATAAEFGVPESEGVLNYKQAHKLALDLSIADEKASAGCIVADAVEQHRGYAGKKGRKSDANKEAAYRSLRWNVLRLNEDGTKRDNHGIGHIVVNDLTADDLLALRNLWATEKNKSGATKSEATVLRNWTTLHSCLERAASVKANGITNGVWRTPERGGSVPAMHQELEGRLVAFSDAEALAIIEHARAADALVGDYFEALYRTGARPGKEIFTLAAGDFNARLRRISIRAGKTGPRPQVSLGAHAVALFARLTAGRPANERIFASLENDQRRVKAALVAAVKAVNPLLPEGVEAEDVVPYAFRHTFISRRIEAGAKIKLLAEHCGNSAYIIEKTYAHLCPSALDQMINDTEPQPVLQVVPTKAVAA